MLSAGCQHTMSTRLSSFTRRRFVNAVMESLPISDHEAEKNDYITKNVITTMPDPIKALIGTEHECWINQEWCYNPIPMYAYSPRGQRGNVTLSAEAKAHIATLDAKISADAQRRNVLRNVLKNMLDACTNSNQIIYGLPEFKHLLPPHYLALPPPSRKVKIPEVITNDCDVVMELLLDFGLELED